MKRKLYGKFNYGFQNTFNMEFMCILKQAKPVFLDTFGNLTGYPTDRIGWIDSDGHWLVDIQSAGKNQHFWVNYSQVWNPLKEKFDLSDDSVQQYMRNTMKTEFPIKKLLPYPLPNMT